MDELIWDLYPYDAWNKPAQFGERIIAEIKANCDDPFEALGKILSQANANIIESDKATDVGTDLAYIVEIEYDGKTNKYRYQVRGNHRPMPGDPGRHH